MALGAQQGEVLQSVLRSSTALIADGVITGLVLACAVTFLIQHQLWGVKPTDPGHLRAVAALVLSIGLFACVGPARRATEVSFA